jgi:hypothetical protein
LKNNLVKQKGIMSNYKTYLLGLAIMAFLMAFLLTHWDGSYPVTREMEWVLKQLPDVKSVEFLESLKNG